MYTVIKLLVGNTINMESSLLDSFWGFVIIVVVVVVGRGGCGGGGGGG